MTATPAPRRMGGLAVGLALVAGGLTAGVALGAPASATGTGAIQVRMAGQADYSSVASRPLLDVAGLAPGGSVDGTMQVRDNGDAGPGPSPSDTLRLRMINVRIDDSCPAREPSCPGSGSALAAALRFSLDVTDVATGATVLRSAESLATLTGGVTLASGLTRGDEIRVHLAASLPVATGDEVQHGTVGFDLQLDLRETTAGTGTGGGAGQGETLVIGPGSLSETGLSIRPLLTGALALLAGGLLLLLLGTRWRRRHS